MKKITYQYVFDINLGTDENPDIVQRVYIRNLLSPDDLLEANLAFAEKEAYNGEYTVEDVPDEVKEPTQLDQIEAQVTYTALMTDTLLEV